jgi:lysine biosynthesis protein LysW
MVAVGKNVTVTCLDCERPIRLGYQPVEGQIITCPYCDVELEVISAEPLELDFYFEDWDEDEEWDPYEDSDEDDDWEDDEDAD